MKKRFLLGLLAAAVCGTATAETYDQQLAERNRKLDSMNDMRDRLALQAEMSKLYKEMSDAGFIVDENGNPQGIGTMERLALEVRRRSGIAPQVVNPNDPFGGSDPVIPTNGDFFGMTGSQMPLLPPNPTAAAPKELEAEKVEIVSKPSEREKESGKKILRLVEIRSNAATFFTNEGFLEVAKGGKVYDKTLKRVGVDSVTVSGPDGDRVLRIDWTKSVRYADD